MTRTMAVYVINLDADTDRLAHMRTELAGAGLGFVRISGVDGRAIGGRVSCDQAMTPGEVGCYLSHLSAMRMLTESGEDAAMVVEDDVRLCPGLQSILKAVLASPVEWDIVRLSNAPKSVVLPVWSLPDSRELVRYWTVPNNTGAYIISRRGAEKFLAISHTLTMPIDEAMRRPWRSGLLTYGVVPPPVEHDIFAGSSITARGRPEGIPARARFADAAPLRDAVGQWTYRRRAFGRRSFARALIQEPLAAAVRRVLGREAAAPLFRMPQE